MLTLKRSITLAAAPLSVLAAVLTLVLVFWAAAEGLKRTFANLEGDERPASAVVIHRDPRTGCEYLRAGDTLTPRMEFGGAQRGCYDVEGPVRAFNDTYDNESPAP